MQYFFHLDRLSAFSIHYQSLNLLILDLQLEQDLFSHNYY